MSAKPQKFDFDEDKVERTLIDYRRTMMEEEQTEIANDMGRFLAQYIDIFENTLRSFISLSISLWQTSEKKFLKEVNDESPEVRYQTIVEICDYFKKLLTGLLKSKGQAGDLENAIDLALKYYKDKWSDR